MTNEPTKGWLNSLPNQLTLFRIAVIPILLALFPLNFQALNTFCAVLFAVAAFTDWLDGYIARKFSLESKLGTLIDPIADKMLIAAALVLLAANGILWAWVAGLLICREMAMSGLRLVAQQQGIVIKVNVFGKLKTMLLDFAVFCLMINRPLFDWPFVTVGLVSLWLAVFFSLYSAWLYVKVFLKEIEF